MGKIRIFVALAIGLFSASAFSQWYAGLGPGVANGRVGGSVGGLALSANDSRSTSFKLYGGYQFTPHWGLELQYADLGRFGYTGCAGAICGTGSARASQWSLAGTGTMQMSNNYYLLAKLGVTQNDSRGGNFCAGATCAGSIGGNRSDLLVGVGIGYNFTPRISMRLEYEHFGKIVSGNGLSARGDNWAASLRYAF